MELYWNKYNKTLDIIIWKEYYITIKNKKINTTTDKENKKWQQETMTRKQLFI